MMKSSKAKNKTKKVDSKFLKLKRDLKLMIISYLPYERSFYSLITCNKSFKILLEKFKVYDLIISGLIKHTLKEASLTEEFKEKMISNWGKYFEDEEDRDKFISRVLERLYSGNEIFVYDKDKCPVELDKAYFRFLSETKAIKQLNLSGFDFGRDEEIRLFKNNKIMSLHNSLKVIDFERKRIKSEGAQAIGEALRLNTSLQEIYFFENQIGNEGAKAIANLLKTITSLQMIDLRWNEIGDEGGQAIGDALKKSSLRKILLGINELGDEGAKAIADSLRSNTALEEISLHGNKIRDKGAQAIADSLRINTSLQKIWLEKNLIEDEGAKAFAEALTTNTSIKKILFYGNPIEGGVRNDLRNKFYPRICL